jgi:DNA invertase Pin-like site-specific DNA recombinase
MEKYIGYVRTSTGRQVLGLDEQKSRLNQFTRSTGDTLVEIITEQETGKNNNRIGLETAINICIKKRYTLLFTKLDRLSREVEFLFTLRNRGVKLRCIELPELNTLTLGIFGTMAQYEREVISNRTKSALAELKKTRKLGTPSNLTSAARKKGVETIVRNRIENDNWKTARMFIEHFQMKHGYLNYSEISRQLNEHGYRTRNGCVFSAAIVKRLIKSII